MCSKEIYEIACSVLSEKTIEKRREKLANVPGLLRPHVEKEARRVWKYREENEQIDTIKHFLTASHHRLLDSLIEKVSDMKSNYMDDPKFYLAETKGAMDACTDFIQLLKEIKEK